MRLNIILNLATINGVVGVELLGQSLLPAITELSEDSKWRVRLAIIERIPLLAEKLGRAFFSEKLSAMCLNWLGDEVYSIRRATAENLKNLVDLLGDDWVATELLPKIEKMCSHTSHVHRMSALDVIQVVSPRLSASLVETTLLPMVMRMAADNVPNVRFTVAKTLRVVLQVADPGASSQAARNVSALLSNMAGDSDRDVRFFASKNLAELQIKA